MSSSGQHVLAVVRRQILSGARAPGEKISEVAVAGELAVSRTPARTALAALEAEGLIEKRKGRGYTVRSISQSDVANAIAVKAALESLAAKTLAERGLNAETDAALCRSIAVTQAMLPLLRHSKAARIVNIGSTGGSLSWNSRPDNDHRRMFGTYSTSKSAAHAVSLAFAFALEKEGIRVNIACPGHTATALNNFSGARSIEEGAREAVRLAVLGPDGPTGTFSDEDGPVDW